MLWFSGLAALGLPGHPLYFHHDATAYDSSGLATLGGRGIRTTAHPTLEPSRRTSGAELEFPEVGEVVVAGMTFQSNL